MSGDTGRSYDGDQEELLTDYYRKRFSINSDNISVPQDTINLVEDVRTICSIFKEASLGYC